MKKNTFLFILCAFFLLFVSAQPVVNLSYVANACNSSWTVSAGITGGTPPFTYNWSTGQTTASIIVSSVGQYCVTVADANGATANACLNVNTFNVTTQMPVYCMGDPIVLLFDGGTPPYNINWMGQTGTATSNIYPLPFFGPPGVSMIDFTDANGCTFSLVIEQWMCGGQISGGNICGGVSSSLCAGFMDPPGTIYDWSLNGTPLPSGSTSCINATQPGNYCCNSQYPNGMVFSSCFNVLAFPTPVISVADYYGCVSPVLKDTLVVNMTTGVLSYVNWSGAGTAFGLQNNAFSVSSPSTVNISAISTDGCVVNDVVVVDFCDPVGYVEGTVFSDINGNNSLDANDLLIPYKPVALQPGFITLTQSNGVYHTAIDTLTSVNISTPAYQGQLSTPTSHIGYVTNAGMIDSGNDFYFPPQLDLKVTLAQLTNIAPGFGGNFAIHYENLGISTNANIEMTYDPNFNFIHAVNPPFTSQNGNTLTWNVGTLAPGGSGVITIDFDMPPTFPLGTPTVTKVKILPIVGDADISNNQDSVDTILTGAFDPNDKQVSFEKLTLQEVANAKPLDYMIRFQNTGTAPAQEVIVLDTLSNNVNIESFTMMAASHDFSLVLIDGHILQWTFANIQLPDSFSNEPESHGYIRYRIRPLTTLTEGSTIDNSASIYFDFNAPVKTNTVSTIVMTPQSINDPLNVKWSLAPNPATDKLSISMAETNTFPTQIEIWSMDGKKIETYDWEVGATQTIIPVKALPAGVYLLQIHTETGILRGKFLKQ